MGLTYNECTACAHMSFGLQSGEESLVRQKEEFLKGMTTLQIATPLLFTGEDNCQRDM